MSVGVLAYSVDLELKDAELIILNLLSMKVEYVRLNNPHIREPQSENCTSILNLVPRNSLIGMVTKCDAHSKHTER
jgi:hypothetical protein